jgi:hypothetical protein
MTELQSSPVNDKPGLDGLFPELKRPESSARPRMTDAMTSSPLFARAPISQRLVPPPPSIRTKSAPPPPPAAVRPPVIEEVTPIEPAEEDYSDEGPTVLRTSPLIGAPISARPQLASAPRPSAPIAPPPSRHAAAPLSATKLPPVPTPPPSLRSAPMPPSQRAASKPTQSAAKLPPIPMPPSSLRNAMPSPPPTSAPLAAPVDVDDEAETTAPPTVQPAEQKRDSFAPAAMLAATAAASNSYVPPVAPPKPARPLSALETIPASRYHSLAPQVLSQSVMPPAPQKRSGLGLLFAAAATLGLAAVAGFFALGGVNALGLGHGTGSLAVTAAGPGSAALDGVRVLVDGTVACETSPCELGNLSAGTHFVTVEAKGFAKTAARAVSVEKNGAAALDVELVPEQTTAPVAAKPETDIAPAIATPEPVAKTEPTPAAPVAQPKSAPAAKSERVEKKVASTTKKEAAKEDSTPKKTETAAQPAAMGTLNINSIPVANVVLDGRPMGSTPLVGLSVAPGPHSVVFIHPEKGRKASGTTVKAGSTSTVAVRF